MKKRQNYTQKFKLKVLQECENSKGNLKYSIDLLNKKSYNTIAN